MIDNNFNKKFMQIQFFFSVIDNHNECSVTCNVDYLIEFYKIFQCLYKYIST